MLGNLVKKLLGRNKQSPISLVVVFVQHDPTKYGNSFPILQNYLSALNDCPVTYIIVDNKHENLPAHQVAEHVYQVGGDNKYREFSGWQKGWETTNQLGLDCDIVLFTNEAFLAPGESFLKDYATTALLERVMNQKAVIGRIDRYPIGVQAAGYQIDQWVCSNCMFVPQNSLKALGDLVFIKDNITDFIPEVYDPCHTLGRITLTAADFNHGKFTVEMDCHTYRPVELRIVTDKSFVPKEVGLSADERQLSFVMTHLSLSGQEAKPTDLIRGIYEYPGWVGPDSLSSFHGVGLGRLKLEGHLPLEYLERFFNGSLTLTFYNDAYLFQEQAAICKDYQRLLIEWLTVRWHSKFVIGPDTWSLFRTKVAAILNESLLSARLAQVGCSLQEYGSKHYY